VSKAARGSLRFPSPPIFLVPRRIKMKRFFGTTLAILSVYAVWAACYAGPSFNPTTLA
jgi:hypothetical protein